jgi:deazaflavin-dependent oxidoreductase (nitroreductase family)
VRRLPTKNGPVWCSGLVQTGTVALVGLEPELENAIRDVLGKDRTIDITTIGRRSGLPSRIETWFYRVDDRVYLTGSPGRRDWYANLVQNPDFTFHLKQTVVADLAATAVPITDPCEREAIFQRILSELGRGRELNEWLAGSPLMAVSIANLDGRD